MGSEMCIRDRYQPLGERELLGRLREVAAKNRINKSCIGMGYADCITPPVIQRNILENPAWYTQYTPYQSEIAQGRLGPGRIHHCMRLIGSAQRALEFACRRATERETFGRKLADHQSVLEDIARSFNEIEQGRLLTLKTARKIDETGAKDARDLIAAAKITVPLMAQTVIDRCMQIHGAGGLTADYPMAEAFNYARWCRQADGPDQVHMTALGKQLIRRYAG